jgi:5'-methylthioadenosine phosphorylase
MYFAMKGQQFYTQAESRLYREVKGCDVIGMTNMPEAKLAREAELCYASVAIIIDFGCWHDGHAAVQMTDVLATLAANSAHDMVAALPGMLCHLHEPCAQGCDHALDHALVTAPQLRDPDLMARRDAVAGRILNP